MRGYATKGGGVAVPVVAALPQLQECEHGGSDADIVERCMSCQTGDKHVRECVRHKLCTREFVNKTVMSCRECQASGLGFVPIKPKAIKEVRAKFIHEFKAVVREAIQNQYPEGRFNDTGIVIPAGGWKMLPGVYVTLGMLRRELVGSRLPVEVWYIGDEGEFDPLFATLTAGMNVTWRNISDELRRLGITRQERLWGWAVKPLALMLSSFERVLMLDSDCYPVYTPENLLAHPDIAGKPAAFWPDYAGTPAGRPLTHDQWEAFGFDMVHTPGFESGQMVVDKRKSWAAVQVAAHLSDRMDYFDATRKDEGKVGIHGDKEIFNVAWNATKTQYHMAHAVRYHEVAFLQHDPNGAVAFVHRCNDKPKIVMSDWKHSHQTTGDSPHNYRSTTLHHEHKFHALVGELREKLRPSLPGFRDGTQDEQVWSEVHVENVYRLPRRMDGWTVIDVGAHAGFFTIECCNRGVGHVISVEPYPANAAAAKKNLAPWVRVVTFIEKAVARPGVRTVAMRPGRTEWNTGEPFVASCKGLPGTVDVPAVSLDELIGWPTKQIDLLKLDCEHSEYPALLTCTKLKLVDRIAGEYHTDGDSHDPKCIKEVLEKAGFAVEMDDPAGRGTGMFFAVRPGVKW